MGCTNDEITLRNNNELTVPRTDTKDSIFKGIFKRKLFSISKIFEKVGALYPYLGKIYGNVLYKKMVVREVKVAGVKRGMNVLHIGCGALPATAIYLAEMGCAVTASDIDPNCARKAKDVIQRNGLSDMVRVIPSDGVDIDASGFDAVWVSIQVRPKEHILKNIMDQLKDGASLVYRNPRGLAGLFYPSEIIISPGVLGPTSCFVRVGQTIGKESVIVKKHKSFTGNSCANCHSRTKNSNSKTELLSLEKLPVGMAGKLTALPRHSLLPPLGLRPGKPVTIQSRQFFGGPIIVEVQGRTLAIGRSIAKDIYVESGGGDGKLS